jgi:HSP20 family protein
MFEKTSVLSPQSTLGTLSDAFVAPSSSTSVEAEHWRTLEEGQLSVDVFETTEDLYIVATMAGTKAEDIELHLHNDFLTIRGRRAAPVPGPASFFYEECFWGTFSRTIVLPVDVKSELAQSEYKNGVLTIKLPKARLHNSIPILVVEE